MPTPPPGVAALVPGLTFRRLDYWTRQGWIRAVPQQRSGTGIPRAWRSGELAVAAVMVWLVDAGLTPAAAAGAARALAGGTTRVELAEGVWLVVDHSRQGVLEELVASLDAELEAVGAARRPTMRR